MIDEAEIVLDAQPNALVEGLGGVFIAARNQKNLTLKDVSDKLRLSIKQIEAIESNDFKLLPEAMITRGFIRNYARLLEIDAEPLLLNYRALVPEKLPNALSVKSSIYKVMPTKDSQPWLKYILGSILLMLFLLAWFFYMDYVPKPVKTIGTKSLPHASVDSTQSAVIPLPEVALPIAERQSSGNDSTDNAVKITTNAEELKADVNPNNIPPKSTTLSQTLPYAEKSLQSTKVNNAANLSNNAGMTVNSLATNPLKPSTPNVSETNSEKLNPTQLIPAEVLINKPNQNVKIESINPVAIKNKVSMTFSDKTWVRITNNSGKVIFEKTMSEGTSDGFDGVPPFNLVIGNAKSTNLFYLGKPIDLSKFTKNNVARITLE